jgi:hypothetical protein
MVEVYGMSQFLVLENLSPESVALAELALRGVVVTVSVVTAGEVGGVEEVVEGPIVVQDGQQQPPPPLRLWSWYSSHVAHCFGCESTLSRQRLPTKASKR